MLASFIILVGAYSFSTECCSYHLSGVPRDLNGSTSLQAAPGPNRNPSSSSRSRRKRRYYQRRSPRTPKEIFDGKLMASVQVPNEHHPTRLDLTDETSSGLRCMSEIPPSFVPKTIPKNAPFESHSLDVVFLGLSEKFNEDSRFREDLRDAIRRDVFDSTPAYRALSEKASAVMLLPDTSLQGSWKKAEDCKGIRMQRVTDVLRDTFGPDAPTGDDLMDRIGRLCGTKPSTHWIDIVGVQDRKISHSWHLDTGLSPEESKTVLWGFPAEDEYEGCGVFSHVVPLLQETHAGRGHPTFEPIIFQGKVPESNIVRPTYAPGKELLAYCDIHVLHSSPDVVYRTSMMRFM